MLARAHQMLLAAAVIALAIGAWQLRVVALGVGVVILAGVALHDRLQRRAPELRNYPFYGRIYRWLDVWPGRRGALRGANVPFTAAQVALIRARAFGEGDTASFGAEAAAGNRVLLHSLYPGEPTAVADRVWIGGKGRARPYHASILQASALSFGALSERAILAVGRGARAGGFACNTGEGGLPEAWLQSGCDLVWQIGTGLFGCRHPDGSFDPVRFAESAAAPQIRMIELKLSQGGKPGAGGLLPGVKVTPAIARACGIPAGVDSICPPRHAGCDGPEGVLELLARLRELAGDKPTGLKLCLGRLDEWTDLCKAMADSGIVPDFVTIDGAEGGAGAAPIELMRSVGRPLDEALPLLHQALERAGVRDQVRVIASGKIASGHDLADRRAQGADLGASARAFLIALGCVQALQCQNNSCPTGIATQDERLAQGLAIDAAAERVARYHAETIQSYRELMAACGSDGFSLARRDASCNIHRQPVLIGEGR